MGDDVDVDVARLAQHGGADSRTRQGGRPPAPAADPEYQLGGIERPGELDQCARNVAADHLVIAATQLLHQSSLSGQRAGARAAQAILRGDVDRHQIAASGPGGDTRAAAQESLALRSAGQRHDDPFARLPGAIDAVLVAVGGQGLVDLVGQPEQRELTQRGQIAQAEVVRQGRVDALGGIYQPAGQSIPQRLRGEVDHLDLVGGPDEAVGHGLPLGDTCDPLDDIVERFDVLNVDSGDDVDARFQEDSDILPPLGTARTGGIRVGEFVDECHFRMSVEQCREIHLLEADVAVGDGDPGYRRYVGRHFRCGGTAVGFDEPDDHIAAGVEQSMTFPEYRVGLADTGSGAEQDPKPPRSGHAQPPGCSDWDAAESC